MTSSQKKDVDSQYIKCYDSFNHKVLKPLQEKTIDSIKEVDPQNGPLAGDIRSSKSREDAKNKIKSRFKKAREKNKQALDEAEENCLEEIDNVPEEHASWVNEELVPLVSKKIEKVEEVSAKGFEATMTGLVTALGLLVVVELGCLILLETATVLNPIGITIASVIGALAGAWYYFSS